MGCWNETCGLTKLPITLGDRVVVFLIVKNMRKYPNRGGSALYVNDYFDFLPITLRGEYNDYGCIENVDVGDCENLATILKTFDGDGIFIESQDYSRYGVILDLNKQDTINASAVLSIERGHVSLENDNKVGYYMVLESVFDELLKDNIELLYKEAKECLKSYLIEYKNNKYDVEIEKYDISKVEDVRKILDNLNPIAKERKLADTFRESCLCDYFSEYSSHMLPINKKICKNMIVTSKEKLILDIVTIEAYKELLTCGRRIISPSGQTSQENDSMTQYNLAKAVIKFVESNFKKRAEKIKEYILRDYDKSTEKEKKMLIEQYVDELKYQEILEYGDKEIIESYNL